MKLIVDSLTATTGWSGASGGSVFGLNEIPEYIAGLNDKSIIFKFDGTSGGNVSKTFNVNVTDYTDLVFHLWSRDKKRMGMDYKLSSDFAYKIELDTGVEYYVPTFSGFADVTIDISGITEITTIKITSLHADEDYLILSEMLAVYDEMPLDILIGIKEHLEYDVNNFYAKIIGGVASKGFKIGTVSGTAGDTSIQLEGNMPFIERYMVVHIDGGGNSETHQIGQSDEVDFKFNSMYDGAALLNTYAGAALYVTFPVNYNLKEKEIILPGISVWSMSVEEIFRGNKEDEVRDSFSTAETVQSRITPANFDYAIRIQAEARHEELLAYLSNIVRVFVAKKFTWVTGRKIDIRQLSPATYVEPTEGQNQIPKWTYIMGVEIKEELFDKTTLVRTVTNTRTFNIQGR